MFKHASLIILAVLLATSIAIAQVDNLDVLTYHNDIGRTGWYSHETTLTVQNVNPNNFGPLHLLQTDDRVRTTPLYVHGLTTSGGTHNVVFVGDDSANLYAFDADNYAQLWKVSALEGYEQPASLNYCDQVPDHMGIVGTPVIDRGKGSKGGVIYFVAVSAFPEPLTIHQRLWALNLTDGSNFQAPVEIQAQVQGSGHNSHNGFQVFDPSHYYVRAALTEVNDRIYFGFASICDGGGNQDYTGWLMQYNANDLSFQSALNFAPNDGAGEVTNPGYGGTIWSSGTGFASDGESLYVPLGNGLWSNGPFDVHGFPIDQDYGNAFVRVTAHPQDSMGVADYFTMYNAAWENAHDFDLASGGSMVLDIPSANGTIPLAIAAGKDEFAYLCRRDDMGKWNPNNNNQIWEPLIGGGGGALHSGIWGAPAFFNGTIYWGPQNSAALAAGYLQAYTFQSNGKLPQTYNSRTVNKFNYPGTTPSVSSTPPPSSPTNGIVWAVENYTSLLHAYDATNLATELYSGVIGPNPGAHFDTPVIANGKVFVSNLVDPLSGPTGVQVFGLLH